LTFSVNSNLDINGSVFSDDLSTMLVDGSGGRIIGDVYTSTLRTSETKIALGSSAGLTTQGTSAVAVGNQAGQTNQGQESVAVGSGAGNLNQDIQSVAIGNNAGAFDQGQRAVAIGSLAGSNTQGDYAVAIGNFAGGTNQPANSIVINASGVALNGSAAGFFVDPIRSTATATGPVMYNTTTKELFYNTVLEFAGSTISTNDSSGITVDVLTTFNSDIIIENEIVASNGIRFSNGSILKSYNPVTVISATTVAQTIPDSASASPIQFVDTVDTASAFSSGIFTAPHTGYYQFNLSIYFSTTVTLNPGSFLQIANFTEAAKSVLVMSDSWSGSYLHYSTVVEATAGNQILIALRQVSGATIDVSSGSRLTVHRVSVGA
jgi:hypothetical protein